MSDDDLNASAPVETAPEAAPAIAEKPAEAAPSEAVKDEPRDERSDEEKLDDDLRKTFRRAQKELPARADDGKWLPKDGKPQQPAAEAEKSAEPEKPEQPAIAAPNSWTKEAKDQWSKLPPEVQRYVAAREEQVHQAFSEVGPKVKAFDAVHEVIAPHMDRIRAEGVTPPQYLNNLFAADHMLARDPVGFIRHVAQVKGIDLASLFDPFAQPDPQTGQWQQQNFALQAEVSNLRQQLAAMNERVTGREQAEQQSQLNHYNAMIEQFASDKADWAAIGMPALATAIRSVQMDNPDLPPQDVLEEAYDRARWANPVTRKALISAQAAAERAKRLEDAKKSAAQAKRASSINVNGTVAGRGQASLDDDLRAVYRRHHSN